MVEVHKNEWWMNKNGLVYLKTVAFDIDSQVIT